MGPKWKWVHLQSLFMRNRSFWNGGLSRKDECDCASGMARSSRVGGQCRSVVPAGPHSCLLRESENQRPRIFQWQCCSAEEVRDELDSQGFQRWLARGGSIKTTVFNLPHQAPGFWFPPTSLGPSLVQGIKPLSASGVWDTLPFPSSGSLLPSVSETPPLRPPAVSSLLALLFLQSTCRS